MPRSHRTRWWARNSPLKRSTRRAAFWAGRTLDASKLAHALSGFKLPPEIALQPGAPAFRAGDHELMSTVFVGEAHPPQGDPDNMFTVKNPVPGEKAAGPAEDTGCKIQWPA
jgi:branched-chain amino acid transport system substrate-binding protein